MEDICICIYRGAPFHTASAFKVSYFGVPAYRNTASPGGVCS